MIINTKAELCICSSWVLNDNKFRHGVSGHIFEIIEYFYIIRHKYQTKILLGDPKMTRSLIEKIIRYKYNFDEQEINIILNSIIICDTPPKHIIGKIALFVDGCLIRMQQSGIKLHFNKIYTFKCSKYETIHDLEAYKNVVPLLDYRVYKNINQQDVNIGINYRKKILINKLKVFNNIQTNTALLYLTNNCRKISVDDVLDVIDRYSYDNYIIISDIDLYNCIELSNVRVLKPPVENLYSLFDAYIYTPIKSKWDGSPRFPVECVIQGKTTVYFNIDDDYLSVDRGLHYRKYDIENNFNSLRLTECDSILDII
jgi:hypothetical protein